MIKTVKEVINELTKYPKGMKVYSNSITQNLFNELVIEHKRTPEEEKTYKMEIERLNREYQERQDRKGEITSFANRW